jgi:hypothetical protein
MLRRRRRLGRLALAVRTRTFQPMLAGAFLWALLASAPASWAPPIVAEAAELG